MMRSWPIVESIPDRIIAAIDFHYNPGERLAVIERYGLRWCSTLTGAFLDRQHKGCNVRGWLCSEAELVAAFPAREDDPPEDAKEIVVSRNGCLAILRRTLSGGWVDALNRSYSATLESWHCELGVAVAKFDLMLDIPLASA